MKICSRRNFLHTTVVGIATAAVNRQVVATAPEPSFKPLRIALVTPTPIQPQEHDPAVIFYDDFHHAPEQHTRYSEVVDDHGSFIWVPNAGMVGGSMRCQFEKDQVDAGRLHVLLGKNPIGRGHRPDEIFREIYWRVYLRHEPGWEGNPAKLARATCMAGRDYSQGMIAHVWGGQGDVLCIDPATGIRDSQKVTTRYNDFANLKWLGSRQGKTPIFSPAESGRWVCVESHIKLNSPGQPDGIFELWVDGKLEASRTDLNWHGEWQEFGINAVFLENYCNTNGKGSVRRQARWFDNFIVSTHPVGPITAGNSPEIVRTLPQEDLSWETEVGSDPDGKDIVWQSNPMDGKRRNTLVDSGQGRFTGSRLGKTNLAPGMTHWARIRQSGQPGWSPWHAPFTSYIAIGH